MPILDYKTPEPDRKDATPQTPLQKWERRIIMALVFILLACALACGLLKFVLDQFQFSTG